MTVVGWVGFDEKDEIGAVDKQWFLFILTWKFALLVVVCVGPGCQLWAGFPLMLPPSMLSRVAAV
jgi:hypothetical protein